MIKKTTVSLIFLLCFYSCGKQEASTVTPEPKYEYDPNSEQYSKASDSLTKYENPTANKVIETPELTNIEKYSQLKVNQGAIIECESTIEFIDGKTDNITIKMQIPHEEPNIINLRNPVRINNDNNPEVISKMYTDNNDEKVVFMWRKDMTKISILNGDNSVMFLR